jgi:hypothetical protein
VLLIAAGRGIAPPANLRTKIEDHWAEICTVAPTPPKIAIYRPLF